MNRKIHKNLTIRMLPTKKQKIVINLIGVPKAIEEMGKVNRDQEEVVMGIEAEVGVKETITNEMKTTNLPLLGTEEGNGRLVIYPWKGDLYSLEKTET